MRCAGKMHVPAARQEGVEADVDSPTAEVASPGADVASRCTVVGRCYCGFGVARARQPTSQWAVQQ